MTNPDSTVGTNAGYNGRTTPNAFNDILAAYSRGLVSGWACTPKTGMTVQLGGNGTTRDVAIAEDNAGNRTTINNRTATPVEITLAGAPATGNRIDSIVAYVENPQNGSGSSDVDFPSQVGIIAVSGTAAGTPSAPTEANIRTAITADGATGASAYYVVLANITVGQGVTTIGSGVISAGASAIASAPIADGAITNAKLANSAVTSNKINWADLQPTKTTETTSGSINLTWQKRTHKDGRITYDAAGSASWWTGAGTWSGDTYITLPVAFNASTMSCTVNAIGADAAITVWGCAQAGSATLPIYRVNHYTQDITTNVSVCCHLEVYPS